jgi:hypothetical protein
VYPTHNLEKLLKVAGLKPALDADTLAKPGLYG